jgi:hypothetical protein
MGDRDRLERLIGIAGMLRMRSAGSTNAISMLQTGRSPERAAAIGAKPISQGRLLSQLGGQPKDNRHSNWCEPRESRVKAGPFG